MDKHSRTTKLLAGGGLVLAGVGVGAVLAVTGSASASTDTAYGTGYGRTGDHGGPQGDPTKSMRPDEKLLTGTTAAKVKAAALAKFPGATVQRVETDSEGVYEAHVVTKAGQPTIVQVGKDFTVTGTQTGGPGGGHGGPGGHRGDGDGDGPGAAPSGESGGA